MNRSIVRRAKLIVTAPALTLALAVVGIIACTPGVAAAGPRALVSDQPDKLPVAGLLDELDDIDFVRSLTPLKLSAEQIGKLVTAITEAKTAYDKKIADLSEATVGAMADEIHKRHKEAVAGGPVSETFDNKVKRMMADFYAKRDTINTENIVSMTASCGKILTAEQQKAAAQLERDTLAKVGKKMDPKNTDAQYYNLYVVDIFIGYRRIVPLLKDLKPGS